MKAPCVGDNSDASQTVTYYNSSEQILYGKEIALKVPIECNDAHFQITENITKTSRRPGSSFIWLLDGCGSKGSKGDLIY